MAVSELNYRIGERLTRKEKKERMDALLLSMAEEKQDAKPQTASPHYKAI